MVESLVSSKFCTGQSSAPTLQSSTYSSYVVEVLLSDAPAVNVRFGRWAVAASQNPTFGGHDFARVLIIKENLEEMLDLYCPCNSTSQERDNRSWEMRCASHVCCGIDELLRSGVVSCELTRMAWYPPATSVDGKSNKVPLRIFDLCC